MINIGSGNRNIYDTSKVFIIFFLIRSKSVQFKVYDVFVPSEKGGTEA